jgi:hypothetical protein
MEGTGIDGNSDGIAGIDGRTVVRNAEARSPGIVGKAVAAGRESVGSIEGRIAIRDLNSDGTDGSVVNVLVGNGVRMAPDGNIEGEGKILSDGMVKPNWSCRCAAAAAASVSIVGNISNGSY